ncbi:MAG: ribosome biogenesis GTP-binding protein YihA/YsxC [Candidatus Gastranaerophilales bacterium]|nr:ribosome biogenesis GTP-binding protein YihA/YsxC [Candidatus Gastranaerophilales bacterium]
MKIKNAQFIKSADVLKNCPALNMKEVALLGRSNVGKSSFINKICQRKALAKTSNTPGKTRLMNYFVINDEFAIVDLPGYGYAKVSKTEQEKWRRELESYILNRSELAFVIQFIDGRHDVQNNDLQMREWLDYHGIKTYTVLTKMDYLKQSQAKQTIAEAENILQDKIIPFSIKQPIDSRLWKIFDELT